MQRVYFNWPIYIITIPIAAMESGGGTAVAEGVGFEPTRRSARLLVVFQTTALPIRLTPPILKHIGPMFQKKLHIQYIYYLY